jgi:predicted MFS family arabinose efflux permease
VPRSWALAESLLPMADQPISDAIRVKNSCRTPSSIASTKERMTTNEANADRLSGTGSAGLILAAGLAFTLSLAGSALKSTVQVYFSDVAASLSVGIGLFAWSTTLFAVGIAVASPVVGYLADRFGGAIVLVAGSLITGGTFLACAVAPSTYVFAPIYGLFGSVAFTMLSYVPLGKLADELFAERGEALAYAVMTNGPAVGFMVLVPLWVWLGTFLSWRAVFVFAGIFMILVLVPLAAYLRHLTNDDGTLDGVDSRERVGLKSRLTPLVGNYRYLALTLAFGGRGVTMAFVDVHMVTDMHMANVDATAISASIFLLGLLEIVGALAAGKVCDRGYVKQTLLVGYGLRGIAMLTFAFTPTIATSLAFGVIFGSSYMATVVATTIWISRILPSECRATALGLVWTVHSINAALSSQVGAALAEKFRSYALVALCEALIVFGSLVVVAFLGVPNKKTPEPGLHDDDNSNLASAD